MQMRNHDIFSEHSCKCSKIMFYCIIKRRKERWEEKKANIFFFIYYINKTVSLRKQIN